MLKSTKMKLVTIVGLLGIIGLECQSIIDIYNNSKMTPTAEIEQLVNDDMEAAKESIFQTHIILLEQKIQELEKRNAELKKEIKKIDDIIEVESSIVQGVNRKQLREIIKNTLRYLGEKNINKFADLLMLTAQIESDLGHYYKQVKGPAVGVFQIEPATEKEIWKHYLRYQKSLAEKIKGLRAKENIRSHECEWNIAYSTGLAYSLYKWRKVDPSKMTGEQMYKAYKKSWNTYLGKSTYNIAMKKLKGTKIFEMEDKLQENYVARK